ncbi:hypothetical protein CDAR_291331 [Caerostris darwini]|uniref:Uncharacterized protein n=1 Tax=Caerostris darwini TaxID=1538125 RepID=A0AAV4RNR8_9ARAC|nr:hypothetical protein CDAR_291331 [Caerostris darwini]
MLFDRSREITHPPSQCLFYSNSSRAVAVTPFPLHDLRCSERSPRTFHLRRQVEKRVDASVNLKLKVCRAPLRCGIMASVL